MEDIMRLDLTKWWNWRPSKEKNNPFEGKCVLAKNSSLRKLARAIQRRTVPEERMFVIETAKERAQKRHLKYLNQAARLRLSGAKG
jgi:cob(I)alamin adenosyltransferase